MTIFNRKEEGQQIRVPELEVQGDAITVHDQKDEPGPGQEKQYKLPKTKWF